jgi:hypothetical protein
MAEETDGLKEQISSFKERLVGVAELFPVYIGAGSFMTVISEGIYQQYIEEHGESLEDADDRTVASEPDVWKTDTGYFRLPEDAIPGTALRVGQFARLVEAQKRLPQFGLVSAVSIYDAFVATLARTAFKMCPEALKGSGRKLTYKDLFDFENLESAKSQLVETEVDILLRKSHVEQLAWFESTFSIDARNHVTRWGDFVELTLRRNLYVHNSGKVNKHYLNGLSSNNVDSPEGVSVDDELPCTMEYLGKAMATLMVVGAKLALLVWMKLKKDELDEAVGAGIDVTLELIKEDRFDEAIDILKFIRAVTKPQRGDETDILLNVNLAQCHKWKGDNKQLTYWMNKVRWKNLSTKFRMAEALLKDEYQRAAKLMMALDDEDEVEATDFEDWPIFREFRNTAEFHSAYTEKYGRKPAPKASRAVQATEFGSVFQKMIKQAQNTSVDDLVVPSDEE